MHIHTGAVFYRDSCAVWDADCKKENYMTDLFIEALTKGSTSPQINTITLRVGEHLMVVDRDETLFNGDEVMKDKLSHTTLTFHNCYECDGENEKPISPDELDRAVMERTSPEDPGISLVDIEIEDDAPEEYQVIPLKAMLEDDGYGDFGVSIDYDALSRSENYEF